MSARITIAADAASGTAEIPARKDDACPDACSRFRTVRQATPESAAATRSASWPRTTMTGSRPACAAIRAARATSGSPSTSIRSLLRPIRVEAPAASTTAATVPGRVSGMDAVLLLPEVAGHGVGARRDELRDDGQRDLFRALRAKIEADRPVDPGIVLGSDRPRDLADARPRSEEPDVLRARGEQLPRPLAVVRDQVRLDDREGARTDE